MIRQIQDLAATGRAAYYSVPSAESQDAQPVAPPRTDRNETGAGRTAPADWTRETAKALAALQSACPELRLLVAGKETNLKTYAANLGKGSYLVVSESFLAAMGKSEAAFHQGKALLQEIAATLQARPGAYGQGAYLTESDLTFWSVKAPKEEQTTPASPFPKPAGDESLIEYMKRAKEQADKRRKAYRVKGDLLTGAKRAYQRLIRAKTQTEVRSITYTANGQIARLKQALAQGCENEKQARAALNQIQRALVRARRKIKDLDTESQLRQRQKKAQEQARRKRADALEKMLRQQKNARAARENGYLRQNVLEQMYLERLRQEEQTLADAIAPAAAPDTASPAVSSPAGDMPAAVTPADVSLSAPVEVSLPAI